MIHLSLSLSLMMFCPILADAFRGIFRKMPRDRDFTLPRIHVYGFSKAPDPEFDFHEVWFLDPTYHDYPAPPFQVHINVLHCSTNWASLGMPKIGASSVSIIAFYRIKVSFERHIRLRQTLVQEMDFLYDGEGKIWTFTELFNLCNQLDRKSVV